MSLDEDKLNPGERPGAGTDAQDVEAGLAAAERGAAGQALRTAASQIAPDPEFALHLEARLLRGAQPRQQIRVRPRYRLQAQDSPPAASWAGRVFGQRRVQFAMSGLAVSLAVLAVFGLSVLFGQGAGGVKNGATATSDFVPPGKVRHLKISDTVEVSGNVPASAKPVNANRTQEVWYTNGRNHLLMRGTEYTVFLGSNPSDGSASIRSDPAMIWVEDQAIYIDYLRENSSGDRVGDIKVYKYPYNHRYIDAYAPQPEILSDWLKWLLPHPNIAGNTILNDRPAILVESVTESQFVPASQVVVPPTPRILDRVWVDSETRRMLQRQTVSTYMGLLSKVESWVETSTLTVILDELEDASQLPSDFFKFELPAGAMVVQGEDPIAAYDGVPKPTATVVDVHSPEVQVPRVGAFAPDFTLNDVRTNQPVKLSSLRGKPVLVNFWGTWCPPCREEMPELQKIYDRVRGQVEFLGISMGPRDEPAGVDQFVKLNKYTWTFLHDTDSAVSIKYQVTGIPSTFFIDKDGVIRSIYVGGAGSADLENGLEKAIAQAPTPPGVVIVEPTYPIVPTPAPTEELAPRMPLEEFKKLYDDPIKRPYIIDVRSKEAYDAGHIEGAISFPEADVDARAGELPKDRLIVAYCQ